MPQQKSSPSTKRYHPPPDSDLDRYAEKVCLKLSETKASFQYDQETTRGLARFLKVVANLEANQRNKISDNNIEEE